MTCEQVQIELKAYLDGELGWLAKRLLKRHLSSCAECRAERDALASVSAELRGNEAFELPETLRARLVALAPAVEATVPRRRMPTLAWGAVGGACLATMAAIYLRPSGAPSADSSASLRFASAPAAPMAEAAPKNDAKIFGDAMENRVAPSMAKPADTFDAAAHGNVAMGASAKTRFDKDLDSKSRGRSGFSNRSESPFAKVPVAAILTDDELIAAVEASGGKVVTDKPLLLELAPENLEGFRRRVGGGASDRVRAKRGGRIVRVRLKTSASVRQ